MDRRQLLLAYAIAYWDTTLSGLRAMARMGMPQRPAALQQIEWELNHFHVEWQRRGYLENQAWGGLLSDHITKEARAFLTEHQVELDELLEGVST